MIVFKVMINEVNGVPWIVGHYKQLITGIANNPQRHAAQNGIVVFR